MPVYAAALLGLTICIALWDAYGVAFDLGNAVLSAQLFAASLVLLAACRLMRALGKERPTMPLAWLAQRLRASDLRGQVVKGAPLLLLCIFVVPIFSNLKSMIPLFAPYTWDRTFVVLDRMLFFGADPWRVLHPVLGHPLITALLSLPYHLWVLLLYPGAAYLALAKRIDERTRRQFFLSYLLGWFVIGGVLATSFASVGPVFLLPLMGDPTFADLNAYLLAADAQYPVLLVKVQALLLERFADHTREIGSGITAMPSMHVAICVLYWLGARRLSPVAGKAFASFAILIWLISIHSGYHYAIDGLVSLVAMVVIWRFAGAVIDAWDRYLASGRYADLRMKTVPTE